jgi:hypothetical protein
MRDMRRILPANAKEAIEVHHFSIAQHELCTIRHIESTRPRSLSCTLYGGAVRPAPHIAAPTQERFYFSATGSIRCSYDVPGYIE